MAAKTFKQIPMLSGTKLTGHAAEFRGQRLSFFVRAALEGGDMVKIRFFNRTALVVSSPEILHEMLVEKARSFYLPFGAGPRVCIGAHFALIEGQLILAQIAQRAALTPVSSCVLQPGLSTTLRPQEPFFMRVHLTSSRPESAAA